MNWKELWRAWKRGEEVEMKFEFSAATVITIIVAIIVIVLWQLK